MLKTMQNRRDFHAAYDELKSRMKARAEADGDVYLPNPKPAGPVPYVFICMEPSLGRWADSAGDARSKVESGFRNFLYSIEDFILHFCIDRYLCGPDERYHITDLSKGAMLVQHAGKDRKVRYRRWYSLLEEELRLVARPDATIFAVGKAVDEYLSDQGMASVIRILHYSPQAGKQRNRLVQDHEESFEVFRSAVTHQDVLKTAKHVLQRSPMPQRCIEQTISRLNNRELTESRKKLMFIYKRAFEATRS